MRQARVGEVADAVVGRPQPPQSRLGTRERQTELVSRNSRQLRTEKFFVIVGVRRPVIKTHGVQSIR